MMKNTKWTNKNCIMICLVNNLLILSTFCVYFTQSIMSASFGYTGAQQSFTVPAGVTSLTIDICGAAGGMGKNRVNTIAGFGARVETTIAVTPGETLYIYIGGRGSPGTANYDSGTTNAGGYNGGANGYETGSAGGGASDIRRGGIALTNRIIVAGGGGGVGACSSVALKGGDAGQVGSTGGSCGSGGGTGGTASTGGTGGPGASPGIFGSGGNSIANDAGGGGGGYYGGGGGGDGTSGGGGSSHSIASASFSTGYNKYNGMVFIFFNYKLYYKYIGGTATFTVPNWVSSVSISMTGATGGSGINTLLTTPGYGALVETTFSVTPGEALNIVIGGVGVDGSAADGTGPITAGGFNGGGNGIYMGTGGGGSSDIRRGGTAIGNRIVVAAGGGGMYAGGNCGTQKGGNGGTVGVAGTAAGCTGVTATGGGGGQSGSGGTAGTSASPGTLWGGGASTANDAGGGGGGLYGGGGGGNGASGGGGSSYSLAAMTCTAGFRVIGNGYLLIDYVNPPTSQPSCHPTAQPSRQPSTRPSAQPSTKPSRQPSSQPSAKPSRQPSANPSIQPTVQPTSQPSRQPSKQPMVAPTAQPSCQPSTQPTCKPSQQPSCHPSRQPSMHPSEQPSSQPSQAPSQQPLVKPSAQPSTQPSMQPQEAPTRRPTSQPWTQPTCQPTAQPSGDPTVHPSIQPIGMPTQQPTKQPSRQPSRIPTAVPTRQPRGLPTSQPTKQPGSTPSRQPSSRPSSRPTFQPKNHPSVQPTLQPSSVPTGTAPPTTVLPKNAYSLSFGYTGFIQNFTVPLGVYNIQVDLRGASGALDTIVYRPGYGARVQANLSVTCGEVLHMFVGGIGTSSFTLAVTQGGWNGGGKGIFGSSGGGATDIRRNRVGLSNRIAVAGGGGGGLTYCEGLGGHGGQVGQSATVQPISNCPGQVDNNAGQGGNATTGGKGGYHNPTTFGLRGRLGVGGDMSTLHGDFDGGGGGGGGYYGGGGGTNGAGGGGGSSFCATSNVVFSDGINQGHGSVVISWTATVPSSQPSSVPSRQPTASPSQPSSQPSTTPTVQPTQQPLSQPSISPTNQPTAHPTHQPSQQPSIQPTRQPVGQPTALPSQQPSRSPTSIPTSQPFRRPSTQPSIAPSRQPISRPSTQPSMDPTGRPTEQPSCRPTNQPSFRPSYQPSSYPSSCPTAIPTRQPSARPSMQPSSAPSRQPMSWPSRQPSRTPTAQPSLSPAALPSVTPSGVPSCQPTEQPVSEPSNQPSVVPSGQPTKFPTSLPSGRPTSQPATKPSSCPSIRPTLSPTVQPSATPMAQPSSQPTSLPSFSPTSTPSQGPTEVGQREYVPKATLPGLPCGLSVLGSYNQSFKILLPWMHVSPSGAALSNIVLNTGEFGINYVAFGRNSTRMSTDLTKLEYGKVFVMQNSASNDYNGRSVSILGDVNGDEHLDLIIGAPFVSLCYVLFGTARGFMNMTEGFTIFGAEDTDLTGWSVSGAGDVNNDTFADIIISSPSAQDSRGAVYVIFGRRQFVDVFLNSFNASDGFTIQGNVQADYLGISVATAGDVNGDGYDDVIMGAVITSELQRGAAYVLYGAKKLSSVILNGISSNIGFAVTGSAFNMLGYSVSSAGDVNGDGIDDILIGSFPQRTDSTVASYLLYGLNTSRSTVVSTQMTDAQGIVFKGGGVVVSGVGDINGDGYDDVMIGSNYDVSRRGGWIVNSDVKYTGNPSFSPTIKPSNTPAPSILGETLKPTIVATLCPSIHPSLSPSAAPTRRPTRPTATPSFAGSNPTSKPSSQPSTPTVAPSVTPLPTVQPSKPTASPSRVPSVAPSQKPSTVTPSTAPSTIKPTSTQSPTATSSLSPMYQTKKTFIPTVTTTNETLVSEGGVVERVVPAVYIVDGSNFTVTFKACVSSKTVGDVFVIYPNPNLRVVIELFYNASDVIDLTRFTNILSMSDLNLTGSPLTINLGNNQVVILNNLNEGQISRNNFRFAVVTSTADHEARSFQSWDLVAGGMAVLLFIVLIFACHFRSALWRFLAVKMGATHKVQLLEFIQGPEEDSTLDNLESGYEEKSDISYESYLDRESHHSHHSVASSALSEMIDKVLEESKSSHSSNNLQNNGTFTHKQIIVPERDNEHSSLFHAILTHYNPSDEDSKSDQGSYQTFDSEELH